MLFHLAKREWCEILVKSRVYQVQFLDPLKWNDTKGSCRMSVLGYSPEEERENDVDRQKSVPQKNNAPVAYGA